MLPIRGAVEGPFPYAPRNRATPHPILPETAALRILQFGAVQPTLRVQLGEENFWRTTVGMLDLFTILLWRNDTQGSPSVPVW